MREIDNEVVEEFYKYCIDAVNDGHVGKQELEVVKDVIHTLTINDYNLYVKQYCQAWRPFYDNFKEVEKKLKNVTIEIIHDCDTIEEKADSAWKHGLLIEDDSIRIDLVINVLYIHKNDGLTRYSGQNVDMGVVRNLINALVLNEPHNPHSNECYWSFDVAYGYNSIFDLFEKIDKVLDAYVN